MTRLRLKYQPVLLAFAALITLLLTVLVFAGKQGDSLVPVTSFDYTNTYEQEGFKIVCVHRGSRSDFREDGSDIAVGDRIIRDCSVKPLP